jgi:hypothetical protein
MAIGRDHIASTVYTIVFAYAGAALPLLMLAEIYPRPLSTILTGADVGEEIVRILVGAIALVLTVPLTTAVATVLATVTRHRSPTVPTTTGRERGHHHGGAAEPTRSTTARPAVPLLSPDTRPAMPALPPPPPD